MTAQSAMGPRHDNIKLPELSLGPGQWGGKRQQEWRFSSGFYFASVGVCCFYYMMKQIVVNLTQAVISVNRCNMQYSICMETDLVLL